MLPSRGSLVPLGPNAAGIYITGARLHSQRELRVPTLGSSPYREGHGIRHRDAVQLSARLVGLDAAVSP